MTETQSYALDFANSSTQLLVVRMTHRCFDVTPRAADFEGLNLDLAEHFSQPT